MTRFAIFNVYTVNTETIFDWVDNLKPKVKAFDETHTIPYTKQSTDNFHALVGPHLLVWFNFDRTEK